MDKERTVHPPVRPRSPRSTRTASLRHALVAVGVCIGLLAGVEAALVLPGSEVFAVLVLYFATAAVYVVAGLIAWDRRPGNPMGGLILAGGLALLVANLANTAVPVLQAVGAVFATSIFAVIAHLLLAFPSGRLIHPVPRTIVIATYCVAFVLQAPRYLFTTEPAVSIGIVVQDISGAAVMIAVAVVLAMRIRTADSAHRRVLLPLFSYGLLAVIGVPVSANALAVLPFPTREVVQLILLAGVPIAFLLGMLRGGFARTGELIDLGEWLSVESSRATVAQALARTLGDDTVRVGLRDDDGLAVDETGVRMDVTERPGRAMVDVSVGGEAIAVIDYDDRVTTDREFVRRAGQVLAIALERTRLSAQLLRSQRELQRSRARIVEAADRERLRIAQDLHDGLQVQLVLLALEAQQIAGIADAGPETGRAATQLRKRVDAAAADLRRLVHDVLPLTLRERGLSDAVEDLVDRMPIPTTLEMVPSDLHLPEATGNTAYFVVAEGLANTVKHAQAKSASVRVVRHDDVVHIRVTDSGHGGPIVAANGLRGLADRVDAIGGSLTIVPRPGEGTTLEVQLPCAS